MSRGLALAALVVAWVTVSLPGDALACAVCFQAKSDASRVAFIATTAAMTFLPLVVIGGVAWWVRRQVVKADAQRTRLEG